MNKNRAFPQLIRCILVGGSIGKVMVMMMSDLFVPFHQIVEESDGTLVVTSIMRDMEFKEARVYNGMTENMLACASKISSAVTRSVIISAFLPLS